LAVNLAGQREIGHFSALAHHRNAELGEAVGEPVQRAGDIGGGRAQR
jgi:hypothetical protein